MSSDNNSKVTIFVFEMLSVAQTGKMSAECKVMNNKDVEETIHFLI